ncbi:MAG: FecR domain-containing protein [Alphaproteobacteria bacterium]|nr:FecR domain-containing protein [Alphaproteobacteria bacterium]
MKNAALIAVIAALFAMPIAAQAAPGDEIGSAVKVVNQVTAAFNEDLRDLTTDAPVRQDELIEVGPDSIGELQFADKTKLALGAGSKMLLDKFVYNGKKARGDIIINLVKGAFRFITGVASKPSYRIRTPGAAITVRGTIFDVFVARDDTVWLLLLEGGITACNDRGSCKALSRPGRLLRVAPDGEVSGPVRWALLEGKDQIGFNRAFPFVVAAPGILPNPGLTRAEIINMRPDKKRTTPRKKIRPKKKKAKKYKKTKKPKRVKKRPKKRAKKKLKPKKRYVKIKRKKKKKVIVKRRRKKKRRHAKKGLSDGAKAAIAIGIGIGVGKMIKGGKGGRHGGRGGRGGRGGGHKYPGNRY